MDDPIITTREAAELLGISIRTAQTWIEQNALDSWKTPGGHRRVRRSAVIDLKARLAGEKVQLPSLVLVHAPQHRLRRYVERLELMPECTVRESFDPFATLLTAGDLLPPVILVDCEARDDDCLRLVRAIVEHPSLGHTHVIMAGDVSRDAAQWRVAARRVHVIAADAFSVTMGAMVRRLLDGARQSTHPAATPLTGEAAGNESQRLMAVAASGLVDTPAEEAFDDITRLAATMLEAPIALLTLLTLDRQWFKSHWGLETGETPRSWAFCNYTILQHEVFVVEDATVDLRFAENPLVTGEPHIRSTPALTFAALRGMHSARSSLLIAGRAGFCVRNATRSLRWGDLPRTASTCVSGSGSFDGRWAQRRSAVLWLVIDGWLRLRVCRPVAFVAQPSSGPRRLLSTDTVAFLVETDARVSVPGCGRMAVPGRTRKISPPAVFDFFDTTVFSMI